MAKHYDKAGLPLLPTKTLTTDQQTLIEQLSGLEDRLNNLLACYRFIGEAVLALTEPERFEEFDDWHLGLFLHQQWVRRQADKLMAELIKVKLSIKT
jgi:hypothetical protein